MTPLVQHEETSPLLPSPDPEPTSPHGLSGCNYLRSSAVAVTNFWTGGARLILLCTFLLQFLISFATNVTEVPIIRLFELAACHQYYDHQTSVVGPVDRIDENLCKVPKVQNELSLLTGFKFGFDAVYVSYLASRPCQHE